MVMKNNVVPYGQSKLLVLGRYLFSVIVRVPVMPLMAMFYYLWWLWFIRYCSYVLSAAVIVAVCVL